MAKKNNRKNSQQWKVGNRYAKFSDFVKANGLDSVIYTKLTKYEKSVYNGLSNWEKKVKIGNTIVKKEVAYRIKKDYESSENIRKKHPDFKEYIKSGAKILTERYINNIVSYNYSLNNIKNKIDKFDKITINGKEVSKSEAKQYINGFNVFKQEGTTIDGNIPVKINPATKELILKLPTPEELEDMADLDEEELDEALQEYGISIYRSAEKTPEQDRAAKDRANLKTRERRAEKKRNIRRD